MYAKTIKLLCAGNEIFVKYQTQRGGLTPPPLCTPLLPNNRFYHYHLGILDLSQQVVRWIKEISRTGSCEPVQSHHYVKCIFSTYSLVWFNIRNSLDAEKAEKLIKKCQFHRAEEDNQ